MTYVNSVGIASSNLPVPVTAEKKNKVLTFKAAESQDRFVNQPQEMTTQEAALYNAIQEQKRKELESKYLKKQFRLCAKKSRLYAYRFKIKVAI